MDYFQIEQNSFLMNIIFVARVSGSQLKNKMDLETSSLFATEILEIQKHIQFESINKFKQ